MAYKIADSTGKIITIERDKNEAQHQAYNAVCIMGVLSWSDPRKNGEQWELVRSDGSVFETVSVSRASLWDRLRYRLRMV